VTIRLYVLVEGQTEERFVKAVLTPHFQARGIEATPIVVATRRARSTGQKSRGGGHWSHWRRDLLLLTKQQKGNEARFTTLFDLYGLPRDFPGFEQHHTDLDTARRAAALEECMKQAVGDWRFIPYLQRHEFESLVLASLDALSALLDSHDAPALAALRTSIAGQAPEDVNDGPTTAPSKRLTSHLPVYQKTLHGPLAVEATGLSGLIAACPRFAAWIQNLEQLSAS
jgi:hypothetical protein